VVFSPNVLIEHVFERVHTVEGFSL
jgi:hypothetical protein